MDGVLVVTLRGGLLLWHAAYAPNFGLPRPTHPMNLASYVFALQSNASAIYDGDDDAPPAPAAGAAPARCLRYVALGAGPTVDFAEYVDGAGAATLLCAAFTRPGFGSRAQRSALAVDLLARFVARHGAGDAPPRDRRAADRDAAAAVVSAYAARLAAVAALAAPAPPPWVAAGLVDAPGGGAALAAVEAAAARAARGGPGAAPVDDGGAFDLDIPLTARSDRSDDDAPRAPRRRVAWPCCRRPPAAAEAAPLAAAPPPPRAVFARAGGAYAPSGAFAAEAAAALDAAAAAPPPPWLAAGAPVAVSRGGGAACAWGGRGPGGAAFVVAAPGDLPASGALAAAVRDAEALGRFVHGELDPSLLAS